MATKDPFKGGDSPKNIVTATGFDVSRLPVEELLALRQQIEESLPAKSIKDLNMAQELVFQMQTLQAFQSRVLQDPDIPPNQVAQTFNALSSSLKLITEMQKEIYTSERMKEVEAILIKHLNKLPLAVQAAFLEDYYKLIDN